MLENVIEFFKYLKRVKKKELIYRLYFKTFLKFLQIIWQRINFTEIFVI